MNKQKSKHTLQNHKDNYIHIPKPSSVGIGKFFCLIGLLFLNYFNFRLIITIYNYFDMGYIFATAEEIINYTPEFIDLIIIYPMVFQYILVISFVILFVSMFKKLKSYNEKGLVFGLVIGLIVGLVVGLIFGLVIGLFASLLVGSLSGLLSGLLAGSLSGLVVGLIFEFGDLE